MTRKLQYFCQWTSSRRLEPGHRHQRHAVSSQAVPAAQLESRQSKISLLQTPTPLSQPQGSRPRGVQKDSMTQRQRQQRNHRRQTMPQTGQRSSRKVQ